MNIFQEHAHYSPKREVWQVSLESASHSMYVRIKQFYKLDWYGASSIPVFSEIPPDAILPHVKAFAHGHMPPYVLADVLEEHGGFPNELLAFLRQPSDWKSKK